MCIIYNFSSKIQTVSLSLLTNSLKDTNQHFFLFMCLQYTVMAKQSQYRPGQALRLPGGLGSKCQDNRYTKVVRLSTLGTGRLYPT